MIEEMENVPNHLENSGEVVGIEQAREVLVEMAREMESALTTFVSPKQATALRRAITL